MAPTRGVHGLFDFVTISLACLVRDSTSGDRPRRRVRGRRGKRRSRMSPSRSDEKCTERFRIAVLFRCRVFHGRYMYVSVFVLVDTATANAIVGRTAFPLYNYMSSYKRQPLLVCAPVLFAPNSHHLNRDASKSHRTLHTMKVQPKAKDPQPEPEEQQGPDAGGTVDSKCVLPRYT